MPVEAIWPEETCTETVIANKLRSNTAMNVEAVMKVATAQKNHVRYLLS